MKSKLEEQVGELKNEIIQFKEGKAQVKQRVDLSKGDLRGIE